MTGDCSISRRKPGLLWNLFSVLNHYPNEPRLDSRQFVSNQSRTLNPTCCTHTQSIRNYLFCFSWEIRKTLRMSPIRQHLAHLFTAEATYWKSFFTFQFLISPCWFCRQKTIPLRCCCLINWNPKVCKVLAIINYSIRII